MASIGIITSYNRKENTMRSLLASAAVLFLFSAASAQTLSINIGTQPVWGPVGYDHVEYYYLPDIDAYYYVPQHQFVYLDGRQWRRAANLPSRYGKYDLYNAHKVVINERTPYMHAQVYRDKYGSFKDRHDQQAIRDSRESKYFVNKNHPEHAKWAEQNRQAQGNRGNARGDNGNGRGNNGNQKDNRGNEPNR
jgi:hypothetical protein